MTLYLVSGVTCADELAPYPPGHAVVEMHPGLVKKLRSRLGAAVRVGSNYSNFYQIEWWDDTVKWLGRAAWPGGEPVDLLTRRRVHSALEQERIAIVAERPSDVGIEPEPADCEPMYAHWDSGGVRDRDEIGWRAYIAETIIELSTEGISRGLLDQIGALLG